VQHDAAQRDPSLMMWIRPNPVFRRLPPAALPFITILAKTALHQKGQKTTRHCVMSCRRDLHDIQCSAKDHLDCDVDNDGQADVRNPSMILQKVRNERSSHAHHRN
jgi:hypothetical protein